MPSRWAGCGLPPSCRRPARVLVECRRKRLHTGVVIVGGDSVTGPQIYYCCRGHWESPFSLGPSALRTAGKATMAGSVLVFVAVPKPSQRQELGEFLQHVLSPFFCPAVAL
jgi:hypothetical protein